jgi:hypothetical protein
MAFFLTSFKVNSTLFLTNLKANSTLFLTNLAVAKSCPVTPRPGKCRQNVSRRAARMRWDFMTSEFLKPNHKKGTKR